MANLMTLEGLGNCGGAPCGGDPQPSPCPGGCGQGGFPGGWPAGPNPFAVNINVGDTYQANRAFRDGSQRYSTDGSSRNFTDSSGRFNSSHYDSIVIGPDGQPMRLPTPQFYPAPQPQPLDVPVTAPDPQPLTKLAPDKQWPRYAEFP